MKRNDNDDESRILELGDVTRRDFLALGAKTAGLISLSSLGTLWSREVFAATQTINAVSWGGAYSMSQKKAYEEPFTKATGVTFQNINKSASGPALLTAQEQTGNVSWDILDILQAPAARLYSQGLLYELDYDKDLSPAPDGTPATEDFVKGSLGGDGKKGAFVPTIAYDTLLSFNKTAFPKNKQPQTIKDVFDLENFPGTRALQKIPAGNLEWALYADGVPRDKIYDVLSTPQGVDRAFKKLDTIKSSAIWWTEGAQPPQMLAQGQAAIASAYNGRIFNAIAADHQPLDFIWDGALYEWDGWVIPASLPKDRLELAKKYLRFSTDTQRLADQAKYIAYAPARKSSIPLIGSYYKDPSLKMMPFMPTTPEHLSVAIPKSAAFWSNYGPQLQQRFSAWLAS